MTDTNVTFEEYEPEVTMESYTSVLTTDLQYGIFRARVNEHLTEGCSFVEFGSLGSWGDDGENMILAQHELRDLLVVLTAALDFMDSDPEDEEDELFDNVDSDHSSQQVAQGLAIPIGDAINLAKQGNLASAAPGEPNGECVSATRPCKCGKGK